MNGGYDAGYIACPCFWGRSPGSLVRLLDKYIVDFSGMEVLDAGCGEGKNAAFLSQRGARVRAIDVSEAATWTTTGRLPILARPLMTR